MNSLVERIDDGFLVRINRLGKQMFLPDNSSVTLEGIASSVLEIHSDPDELSCDAVLPEGNYSLLIYGRKYLLGLTENCQGLASDLEELINDIRIELNGKL